MKSEKSSIIVLGICMVIFAFCGLVYTYRINKRMDSIYQRLDLVERRAKANSTYDTSLFNEITVKDIPRISKERTMVVWLGNPRCGFCGQYAPILNEVSREYNIDINYIDTSIMLVGEDDIIRNMEGEGEYRFFASQYDGTPFTLIIRDNKVVGGLNGYNDKTTVINVFKLGGLIK